jgi:hypothetical protein
MNGERLCIGVLAVAILPLSTILKFDFGIVLTVCFFSFYCYILNIIIQRDKF